MDTQFARKRLEETISRGSESAQETILKVMSEIPEDKIVENDSIIFDLEDDNRLIVNNMGIHDHALQQLASRAKMPITYVRHLQAQSKDDNWAAVLLQKNFHDLYRNMKGRYLMRSIDGQLRGFLSDRYRRLDSRPIVDTFCKTMQAAGAVPSAGHASDTRVSIRGIMPEIHEPTPGEFVAFGVDMTNSDFGNGALTIRNFILRLICLNGMVGADDMRQIHLGKRLQDNFRYSEQTLSLDTQATVSAVRDVAEQLFDKDRMARHIEQIKASADKPITAREIAGKIKQLHKAEAQSVKDTFEGPDTINVPAGDNAWRLANAISWVAHSAKPERAIEMEQIAGKVLVAA